MHVCLVSHRLGGTDGVSMEAAKWVAALRHLGWTVTRAAGYFADHEPTDVTVAGLWAEVAGGIPPAPDAALIRRMCHSADLLVLDNAATLWSAPEAARVWEREALATGVPVIVRHHDPPWQSPPMRAIPDGSVPVANSRFLHVVINQRTRAEYAERWPELLSRNALCVVYNTVDGTALAGGDRAGTRAALGVSAGELLLAHPARLVTRKNVPGAVAFANALDALLNSRVRYWLTDATTEPSGPDAQALEQAPGLIRTAVTRQADLYAAADVVVLPSTWEGWGLPVIEAAAARRPIMAGPYPVLDEIRAAGLTVFGPHQAKDVAQWLESGRGRDGILEGNATAVAQRFNFSDLPAKLSGLATWAAALARGRDGY